MVPLLSELRIHDDARKTNDRGWMSVNQHEADVATNNQKRSHAEAIGTPKSIEEITTDATLECASKIIGHVQTSLAIPYAKVKPEGIKWICAYITLRHILIDSPWFKSSLVDSKLKPFLELSEDNEEWKIAYTKTEWYEIIQFAEWYSWYTEGFRVLCPVKSIEDVNASLVVQLRALDKIQSGLHEIVEDIKINPWPPQQDTVAKFIALNKTYNLYRPWLNMENFIKDDEKNEERQDLGKGGFGGVKTYRLHNGTIVAGKSQQSVTDSGPKILNAVVLREISLIQMVHTKRGDQSQEQEEYSKNHVINIVHVNGKPLIFRNEPTPDHVIFFMPSYKESLSSFAARKNTVTENERGPGFTAEECRSYSIQMCKALSAIHNMKPFGIAHRDIKAGNFLCDHKENEETRIILTDFGLAHYVVDGSYTFPLNDYALSRGGTRGYMAPEVSLNDGTVDGGTTYAQGTRTDMFSLGVTLLKVMFIIDLTPYPSLMPRVNPLDKRKVALSQLQKSRLYLPIHVVTVPLDEPPIEKYIDHELPAGQYEPVMATLFNLTAQMIDFNPQSRPSADDVIAALDASPIISPTPGPGRVLGVEEI